MAPHRHFVVDVTVTRARTNTNVPRIGARLHLHGSLALGADMAIAPFQCALQHKFVQLASTALTNLHVFYTLHHAIRQDMMRQLTRVGSECTDRGGPDTGIG
jgi:hypothetical protein